MTNLDLFLQMDPGLVLVSAISSRFLIAAFIPAVLVIFSVPIIGRVFCGYICPMGTTIDLTDSLFRFKNKHYLFSKNLLKIKYLVLFFLLGAAFFGVSYAFFASPLSLITRLYGLIIFPIISFLSREALDLIRPLGDMLDINSLSFAQIRTIRFDTQFFVLFFFVFVFSMVIFSSRFWCRYLCPTGALFTFFSRAPITRRQVSDLCNQCGKCARKCPMSAIDIEKPEKTFFSECIVCKTCEDICPENAVKFESSKKDIIGYETFSPKRRAFVSTGIVGASTAIISLTGLNSLYGKPGEGQVGAKGLVRPPGAIIETDFLSRCVRCGECMVACPTNTLQPIWFSAGFPALFSPAVTPRRGFCDPKCHECGNVCPTNAIRPIKKSDRIWAKNGTATIIRQKCLAWEFKKDCMVCDEVCPFDAIEFLREKDNKVPVPHVIENKCSGCGYCEHFCPVRNQAAIEVTPMDALRINQGDYKEEAQLMGFKLRLKEVQGQETDPVEGYPDMQDDSAPGFDKDFSE